MSKISPGMSNGQVANLEKIMAPDFACHFINGLEWKGIEGADQLVLIDKRIKINYGNGEKTDESTLPC